MKWSVVGLISLSFIFLTGCTPLESHQPTSIDAAGSDEIHVEQEQVTTSNQEEKPISNWKTFESRNLKFKVKIPEEWKASENGDMVLVGTSGFGGDKWSIGVSNYSSGQPLPTMGSQFSDRQVEESAVSIGEIKGTLVRVTTPSIPSWSSESVYIRHHNKIYGISGTIGDEQFETFYKSFLLLEPQVIPPAPKKDPKRVLWLPREMKNYGYKFDYPSNFTTVDAQVSNHLMSKMVILTSPKEFEDKNGEKVSHRILIRAIPHTSGGSFVSSLKKAILNSGNTWISTEETSIYSRAALLLRGHTKVLSSGYGTLTDRFYISTNRDEVFEIVNEAPGEEEMQRVFDKIRFSFKEL
jgi:hypothetical protein